jgi:hypothetical protein
MAGRNSLIDKLSERFARNGFAISRQIGTKPYRLELVACKNNFGVFKGRMTSFVMTTTMDAISKERVLDFSTRATRYALDNRTTFLPTEPGNSFLVVPVVVSDTVETEVTDWIKDAIFKKRWGTFEFPVLICNIEKATYYSQRTPLWGERFTKASEV